MARYRNRQRFNPWGPYISVAERREQAIKKIAALRKKGETVSPVIIVGKNIANTFWGKAWCKHLESYSDYSNRLPRGRSYVRYGAVLDLKVQSGEIKALVDGSSIYNVTIKIQALPTQKWIALSQACAGKIDSLIELLQGKFSKSVMEIMTHQKQGLFPHPHEIKLNCSCPDYATLCKHVAAVLYGTGARLDETPEHLFLLRQVDHSKLITSATVTDKLTQSHRKEKNTEIDESDLSSLFGIDINKTPKETIAAPIRKHTPLKKTSVMRGKQ